MKIPVLVLQKTSAVFIDISAHGPAIQVSHDRVALLLSVVPLNVLIEL